MLLIAYFLKVLISLKILENRFLLFFERQKEDFSNHYRMHTRKTIFGISF
jgi:hypothetical protein